MALYYRSENAVQGLSAHRSKSRLDLKSAAFDKFPAAIPFIKQQVDDRQISKETSPFKQLVIMWQTVVLKDDVDTGLGKQLPL